MTTPERSIEEIVEEFNSTFPGCDQCQYGNGQGDWIEHWLTQTLQTERQRCEEMVEAERERVTAEIIKKYWLNPKRSKSDVAKDNAWNDLGNTLRNGV